MAYSAKQLRLRVVFSEEICEQHTFAPNRIVKRAIAKFLAEKKSGRLDIYQVNRIEFEDLWELVQEDLKRRSGSDKKYKLVTYTLGCGAPKLPGVRVAPSENDKFSFLLTIDASADEIRSWGFEFVRMNIQHQVKKLGIKKKSNMSQVYGCWLRACSGERVYERSISLQPDMENADNKQYSVICSKVRGEVAVKVFDKMVFRDQSILEEMLKVSAITAKKLSDTTGHNVGLLKEQLLDRFRSALRGPEQYGLKLPAIYLVAIPKSVSVVNEESQSVASDDTEVQHKKVVTDGYPGKGSLDIEISDENKQATIESFDLALYDRPGDFVSIEWVRLEMDRLGVTHGIDEDSLKEISDVIEGRKSLSGFTVATFVESVAGEDPYLHASYKDTKAQDDDAVIDIRMAQQRSLVNTGDLIAEIKFRVEPVDGFDVCGNVIPAQLPEIPPIEIGEGIEAKDDIKFYATVDGVPTVEESSIVVNQIFVQQGDVNLKSGDVYFDGSAEIEGSIDTGATVRITGDLVVNGASREANVFVGGNLEVKKGISTGPAGLVKVKGELLAEFIENAVIEATGDVKAKKAILNSTIRTDAGIYSSEADGVIGGGTLYCSKSINTGSLGFEKGAMTVVFCGLNWRVRRSMELRSERLRRIEELYAEYKNSLRELSRKKQKTAKHSEKIVEIQAKIKKSSNLIEKAKQHLEVSKSQMVYHEDSKILIHKTLFDNVRIELANIKVPVTTSVAAVEINTKQTNGTYVHALQEGGGSGGDDTASGEEQPSEDAEAAPEKAS